MARKPKGEVARSETLAIRLDPKTRYMLELAARIQRRTLSSVVEWMINNSLKDIPIDEKQSLAKAEADLWDIYDPDRLVLLALKYPNLLSFDEQKIWKFIREYGYFWRGKFVGSSKDREFVWKINSQSVLIERIRDCWESIKHQVLADEVRGVRMPYDYDYMTKAREREEAEFDSREEKHDSDGSEF